MKNHTDSLSSISSTQGKFRFENFWMSAFKLDTHFINLTQILILEILTNPGNSILKYHKKTPFFSSFGRLLTTTTTLLQALIDRTLKMLSKRPTKK